jgi:uncharacterized protein
MRRRSCQAKNLAQRMNHVHDALPMLERLGIETFPLLGLAAAILLAGLVGGATHCAGMCGPFVLTQVAAGLNRAVPGALREWSRFKAAALIPYHFGRLTTYAALGAIAGGVAGAVRDLTGLRWLLAAFLALAAAYFAAKLVAALVPSARLGGSHGWVARRITPGIARSIGHADRLGPYGLGVALGFLPCGLVYGALAAAAGSGGALQGTVVMATFALGTMPGLVAVGWLGALAGRQWQSFARIAAVPLLAVNIATLGALALRAFV